MVLSSRHNFNLSAASSKSNWLQIWRTRATTAFSIVLVMFYAQASEALMADNWSSVRANGMGGAFTAVVNDGDSLFINPAGLARNTAFAWTVVDPRGGIGSPTAVKDLLNVAQSSSNYASTLEALYGKNIWVGGGGKSAIIVPHFGFAAFSNADADLALHNPAGSTMSTAFFFDYGFALGGAVDLVPGIFHLGLTARRINRTGSSLPIGVSTLATLNTTTIQNEFKSRGTGYGLDIGTVLDIPGPVSPALSLVYRDVGYTAFSFEEGAHAPSRIEPEIVVGAALKLDAGIVSLTPSFDYRYAQSTDIQTGKKIHLGVELGLPLIDIRAGLNQGYYTLGAGLDLGILRLDAATYGVELGEYPGQLEDRRYVVQLTLELGFDPGSFGLGSGKGGSGGTGSGSGSGGGGGRSRLKQRR